MAANLDYLDPNLVPLEQKVQAYLDAEEELRRTEVEARSAQAAQAAAPASGAASSAIGPGQQPAELAQRIQQLQSQLSQLQQEVMQLLPTRDEWVKVNLGYGPSRVGAFKLDYPKEGQPEYILRVIH